VLHGRVRAERLADVIDDDGGAHEVSWERVEDAPGCRRRGGNQSRPLDFKDLPLLGLFAYRRTTLSHVRVQQNGPPAKQFDSNAKRMSGRVVSAAAAIGLAHRPSV